MAIYFPVYVETEATTIEWHNWLVNIESEDASGASELSTITDVCASAKCRAVLYDEHGFVRGHVHANGDYVLT